MTVARYSIVMDGTDATRVADFWAHALAGEVAEGASPEFAQVLTGGDIALTCQRVDEPKTVKNRVHLDLSVDDVDAEVDRLTGLGATVFADYHDGGRWTTMLDVEGNEFCVVAT